MAKKSLISSVSAPVARPGGDFAIEGWSLATGLTPCATDFQGHEEQHMTIERVPLDSSYVFAAEALWTALASLDTTKRTLEADISKLIQDMEASMREAEAFIRGLRSGS